jgi:hypothetical protein
MRELYVGLDESNHRQDPEICVAVFSKIPKDCTPERINSRNRDSRLISLLDLPARDYRFLVLSKQDIDRGDNYLCIVAPSLVIPYISENNLELDVLRIFIDGRLESNGKGFVREKLSEYVSEIKIPGCPKKKTTNFQK